MPGGVEDPARVVDADGLVAGGVQHEQRGVEPGEPVVLGLLGEVVEQPLPHGELAAGDPDAGGPGLAQLLGDVAEQVRDVGGVGGGVDR